MADMNVSRLGQINQAGDVDALFLKVYGGEVLASFAETNVLMDKHAVRTIDNGKSAQFPVTGKIGAQYMVPGSQLLGQKVNHGEKVITIDDLLVSDAFIFNLDEAKNHYDVRSIYTTEQGRALSNRMDKNVYAEIIKSARSTKTVSDGFDGTVIADDKFKLDGAAPASTTVKDQAVALAAGLFKAAQSLDEKDVPDGPRYAAFRPAEYYALAQNTDLINKLWGGAGAYADGKVFKVAGIDIIKSNHVPKTNVVDSFHSVDASATVGVVWHPMAVGTVKLLDLALESGYLIDRQGWLFVAKYAVGHGVLRPECAVELKLSTLTN